MRVELFQKRERERVLCAVIVCVGVRWGKTYSKVGIIMMQEYVYLYSILFSLERKKGKLPL
jgi:hypothetical protein